MAHRKMLEEEKEARPKRRIILGEGGNGVDLDIATQQLGELRQTACGGPPTPECLLLFLPHPMG